jgi:hypothetical protein
MGDLCRLTSRISGGAKWRQICGCKFDDTLSRPLHALCWAALVIIQFVHLQRMLSRNEPQGTMDFGKCTLSRGLSRRRANSKHFVELMSI